MEQWYIRRRNSQTLSILCSYGNHVETSLSSSCGHTCTHLGILIAGEGKKGRTEKLVNVMVGGEIFTYVKNKKYIANLVVNRNIKIVNGAVWSNSLIFLIH